MRALKNIHMNVNSKIKRKELVNFKSVLNGKRKIISAAGQGIRTKRMVNAKGIPMIEPSTERAYAPHCDQSVLHQPGECEYCDHYSDWQEMRLIQRINYTGHFDRDKAPCPSHFFRDPEVVETWHGNLPTGMFNGLGRDDSQP